MSSFVLQSDRLWIGDGNQLDGHVVVQDDRIVAVERGKYHGELPTIDLEGLALSPGMIDLMTLGGFDKSLLRDDPLEIAREYVKLGVTSCQFCTGTLPWDAQLKIGENVLAAMRHECKNGARMIGLYLEGPFQQPERTGASLSEHALPPSEQNVGRVLADFSEVMTMINVSPGTEGDVQAVQRLREAGKVVSMAHSDAPADRVLACVEAGTSVLGHVWNSNSGLIGDSGVQQPTIEHVALTDDRVCSIHMICDGSHVHPVMVRLVLRCRGTETICLVTDAVQRAGCTDGEYLFEDGRTFVKRGGVGRTDTGGLCGSGLLLPDHLRNFVKFTGLEPHEAIRCVTYNPARSIGWDDRIGILAPGRSADLVAWDDNLQVQRVWRAGVEVENLNSLAEVKL